MPPATQAGNFFPITDACLAADFVVLALSGAQEVGYQSEALLRSLSALGVGASAGTVVGILGHAPEDPSTVNPIKSSLLSYLSHFFPNALDRILAPFSTSSNATTDASTALRNLCEKVPRAAKWRDARARVLAEHVAFEPSAAAASDKASTSAAAVGQEERGTLKIEGVIRGAGRLSVNRLAHVRGHGDFVIDRIEAAPVDRGTARRVNKDEVAMGDAAEGDRTVLAVRQEKTAEDGAEEDEAEGEDADDLQSTNVPDDEELLNAEQTWPTEEEMADGDAATQRYLAGKRAADQGLMPPPPARPGTTPRKIVKRVPEGTSEYQAAWLDESDVEEEEVDDVEEGDEKMEGDSEDEAPSLVDADMGDDDDGASDIASTRQTYETDIDANMTPAERKAQYDAYRAERARRRAQEDRDDMEFPDEVDTPLDIPARTRFARYRGLKSLRTSAWDPYEELPQEYSRCFMLQDWERMSRKLEARAKDEGIEAGVRVAVYLRDVPRSVYDSWAQTFHPLVLFGLLKHEHKYSIMHFTVQRNTECDEQVRSKDSLVVQLGPRRFVVNPVFSQHTSRRGGKGVNNVHKFERYLRHGIQASIASAYLPLTFGHVPAVTWRVPTPSTAADEPVVHLIGQGSLFSSDPTRIVAKRLILSGHPYKVHRRTATIRYMFFNRPDVEYYRPVALRTKLGRTGYIREPLGTHGMFKAGFDGPVSQMDTVLLTLYKRCYPRWGRFWDEGAVEERSKISAINDDDEASAQMIE